MAFTVSAFSACQELNPATVQFTVVRLRMSISALGIIRSWLADPNRPPAFSGWQCFTALPIKKSSRWLLWAIHLSRSTQEALVSSNNTAVIPF